jgi:hypothetical protein
LFIYFERLNYSNMTGKFNIQGMDSPLYGAEECSAAILLSLYLTLKKDQYTLLVI